MLHHLKKISHHLKVPLLLVPVLNSSHFLKTLFTYQSFNVKYFRYKLQWRFLPYRCLCIKKKSRLDFQESYSFILYFTINIKIIL